MKALRGDAGIIECGFVASDLTEAKYFSTPLELGVGDVIVKSVIIICLDSFFTKGRGTYRPEMKYLLAYLVKNSASRISDPISIILACCTAGSELFSRK